MWKFAEDNWKSTNSPNRALALRAASAFPGKKDQSLVYLNQAIKELSSGKKVLSDMRTELVRSVAHAMVRLSPVPAISIPQNIGEEILGLTSDNSHLPALAISSIKPSPISLIIKAIHSKSEATVDEALLAVEMSHPLDSNLFIALLELAGDASPIGETLKENITADRVLASYEDASLAMLEQLAKGKDEAIARKAAVRLLARRSTNKTARDLLLKNFLKLSCGAKFEVVSLLKDEKLFKAEQLKHCISELGGSAYLKTQLASVRQGLTANDWKMVTSQLPTAFLFSECAQGNLLVPEDVIAFKINSSKEELAGSDIQLIAAECGSRISDLVQPPFREKFIAVLEEQLKNPSTIDLRPLAAAIRALSPSALPRRHCPWK